jgi:hypothetical protein
MNLPCLQQGETGIYNHNTGKERDPTLTFCNHAVFVTIKSVDGNYTNFTNRKKGDFPEYSNSHENILDENAPVTFDYRGSNYWCHVLEQQSQKSEVSGIVKINARQAQEYANLGYVVIGSLADLSGPNKSPHFVTVHPNEGYDDNTGPMVAHVGSGKSEIRSAAEAYGFNSWKQVLWYYNQEQQFIYELSYINLFKEK